MFMKEQELEIESLLKEIRSIELAKEYHLELSRKLGNKKRKLEALNRQLFKINEAIGTSSSKWISNIISFFLKENEEEQEALRVEYLQILNEVNECEEFIELQEYELIIIKEKLANEDQLRARFKEKILKREEIIKLGNSIFLQELSLILKQLDVNIKAQKEIKEILKEAKKLAEIVKKILSNMNHELVKLYKTKKYEEEMGFSEKRQRLLRTINELSLELESSFEGLRSEIDDLFNDDEIRGLFKSKRAECYSNIRYGELLAKQLLNTQVSLKHEYALKKIQKEMRKLITFLREHLEVLEQKATDLKKERTKKFLEMKM